MPTAGIGSASCRRAFLPATMRHRGIVASANAASADASASFRNGRIHFYGACPTPHACDSAAPRRARIWRRWLPITTTAAVGGTLPGELREPRRAGRRGDRAHRRPRPLDAERPLRTGHPLGPRTTALSTTRRLPTSWPRASMQRAASRHFAHVYLRNARYGYLRWGADWQGAATRELYPQLREESQRPARRARSWRQSNTSTSRP